MFFSEQNKSIIKSIFDDLLMKEHGASVNIAGIIDKIMTQVHHEHPKPHSIPSQAHLKNLNKLVISELFDNVRMLENNKIDNKSMSLAPYNQGQDNQFGNQGQYGGQGMPQYSNPGQYGGHPQYGGQPQYGGHPQYGGQPQYGQPQHGQPQHGQSPYGQSPYGNNASPGHLPFQQIDPTLESKSDADIRLAQKIAERNTLDGAMGPPVGVNPALARAPNQMPGMQMPSMQMPDGRAPTTQNVHPALVHQFLTLGEQGRQALALRDPMLYHQLIGAVQRMNMQYLGEKEEVQEIVQNEEDPAENEESSKSGSGSGSDSGSDAGSDSGSGSDVEEHKKHKRDNGRSHKRERSRQTQPHKPRSSQVEYLSLDFRNDLREIDTNKYILTFADQHNVSKIELESCLINQSSVLEAEPYIYICIDEIDGDYMVSSGKTRINVFGKLIQSKTINGFLVYQPEHCSKVFSARRLLNRLTVSFVQFDQQRISLTKLHVKNVNRSVAKNYIKVVSKGAHHLTVSDRINAYTQNDDQTNVSCMSVIDTPEKDVLIVETSGDCIMKDARATFERVGVKCTLTFKLTH